SGTASTIAVKFIQGLGDLVNGKFFTITPKSGKSIEIQPGGNIDVPANVTVTDDQFVVMSYYKDTGKVKCVAGAMAGGVAFPIEPTITDNSDTWTGTQTLDLAVGDGHIYKWIMDQNLTFAATVTNRPASGTQRTFELEFVHDGIGGTFTVTLPNNFTNETGKTLTTFNVGVDKTVILTCRINDGTNFLVVQKNVTAVSGGAFLPLAGGTMSGNINLGGQNLTNIGDINDFIAVGGFTLAANQTILIAGSGSDIGSVGQFLSELYVGTINLGDPTDTQTIVGLPTGITHNVKANDSHIFQEAGVDVVDINGASNAVILKDYFLSILNVTSGNSLSIIKLGGTSGTDISDPDSIQIQIAAVDQLTITATDIDFHVNTTSNMSTLNFTDGGSISSLPDRIQISVPSGDIITCRVNSFDQIAISETDVDVKGNTLSGLTTLNWDDGYTLTGTPTTLVWTVPSVTDSYIFKIINDVVTISEGELKIEFATDQADLILD
ncbi:hypothetical protein LCGC14_2515420, partial [marine sediment metagenome]